MRYALVFLLLLISLARLDQRRAKSFLRRLAVALCRGVLERRSKPYALPVQRAVIFAPHPDDETMGCGGLIARKRNDGLPVDVIFLTDGSASHPDHPRFSPADIAAMRRREARDALAVLGVESVAVHFLDEPDGTLHQLTPARRENLVTRIAALLDELRPDEIFLPCNPDGSSEHDAAFAFILESVERSQQRPSVWQYPIWSWWNPLLLFQRMFSSETRVRVPTEDYASIKSRALACYRSQTLPLPPQSESVLPEDLTRFVNSKAEYFFRFDPPAAYKRRKGPAPVI